VHDLAPPLLSEKNARRLVELIAENLDREFPHATCLVMREHEVWRGPRAETPIFFGCYDWHSSVHSHWALLVLARLFPTSPWSQDLRRRILARFTEDAARGELEFLRRHPGFEMPYGIAWLLILGSELARTKTGVPRAATKLFEEAWDRFLDWLDALPAPIRGGEHSQSAFAMVLALCAARGTGAGKKALRIESNARRFYAADRDCPIGYEPSAHDFLSPALSEALLMAMVLGEDFAPWFRSFATTPLSNLEPVTPADRSSGKLVHWDGLNLSRAWMLRSLAASFGEAESDRAALLEQARAHREHALDIVFSGHYAGTHWLGSFALLALVDGILLD